MNHPQKTASTAPVPGNPAPGSPASGSPAPGNAEKPVEQWTTGDEPMTGAQASYLKTLSGEAHEALEPGLTKGEASKKIDELQHKTGRGLPD